MSSEIKTDTKTSHVTPTRLAIGALLLIAAIVTQVVLMNRFRDEFSDLTMYTLMITLPLLFLFGLWWTFFSGFAWKIRLTVVGMIALATGGFFACYEIIGWGGEMIPIVRARWEKSKEERLDDFLVDVKETNSTEEEKRLEISEGDWAEFRGKYRDGIVRGATINLDWKAKPPQEVWRHPVGLGWSSFAIVGDYAFTQEQRKEEECVVCYNALTGQQIWVHADQTIFTEALGGNGPRATPTVYDSKVYALGANGHLNCLDALNGKKIWARNILKDAGTEGKKAANITWAMSASPLVTEEKVFVNPGGKQGKGVIAYDRKTGDIKWATGNDPASYCAPSIHQVDGVKQLLIFDGFGLKGHDIETGKELWRFKFTNQPKVNAAQPIVQDDNFVFIGAGYGVGAVLLQITQQEEKWKVTNKYDLKNKCKLKFNDAVYKAGYVYALDEGILACYEFKTGKRMWKRGRYKFGQILLVGEHLIVLGEYGKVILVEANPKKFVEVSKFQGIEGKTWNHPVLHRGKLYIRNSEEAACYDLR